MSTALKSEASPATLQPPDESTWRRYSPHKEGEMSWFTSLTLHGLVIGVLVALGWMIKEQRNQPVEDKDSWKSIFQPKRQVSPKPVVLDPTSSNPAGKGNPGGPGGEPPPGDNPRPEANAAGVGGDKPLVDKPLIQLDPIETQKLALQLPDSIKNSTAGARFLKTGEVTDERLLVIRNLNEKVVQDLNKGLQGPVGDPNKTGTPEGTGTDPQKGGDPDGGLPGRRAASEREKRMYRWKLDFNLPHNVSEAERIETYLRQLDSLGAILALPTTRDNRGFLVVRNLLARPVVPTKEDPANLRMIYWYETNPTMAFSLAKHLNVKIPNGYIILMPQPLEKKMEELEKEKTPPGVNTDNIEETRFRVIPDAGGGFTVLCDGVRTRK
jgi:hypothetical protein